MKTHNRGGYRKNAGRKPTGKKKKVVSVSLDIELEQKFSTLAKEQGYKNRSELISKILNDWIIKHSKPALPSDKTLEKTLIMLDESDEALEIS